MLLIEPLPKGPSQSRQIDPNGQWHWCDIRVTFSSHVEISIFQ
jgi:hypothetical protein